MKHLLNGCPICGGEVYSDDFNQYSIRRKIKKVANYQKHQKRLILEVLKLLHSFVLIQHVILLQTQIGKVKVHIKI